MLLSNMDQKGKIGDGDGGLGWDDMCVLFYMGWPGKDWRGSIWADPMGVLGKVPQAESIADANP